MEMTDLVRDENALSYVTCRKWLVRSRPKILVMKDDALKPCKMELESLTTNLRQILTGPTNQIEWHAWSQRSSKNELTQGVIVNLEYEFLSIAAYFQTSLIRITTCSRLHKSWKRCKNVSDKSQKAKDCDVKNFNY